MGKEDRFVASISALDGKPKFLLNSFRVGSQTVSNVTGKKLSAASLVTNSNKKKDFDKSFNSAIESKKAKDRLSGPEADSLEAKKLKRSGAFEVNKEKVADWDTLIQKRRIAKSYDFTTKESSQPLETIQEAGGKFKVQTPLEAEISQLLYGSVNKEKANNVNPFLTDHSKDLKAVRQHLSEIAKAKSMARQKEAKDRYQSKIKSKRYRKALRKSKQSQKEGQPNDDALAKADFDRTEERATLRHKTMSKKLRFYDQHNGKESEVRKSQNAESQKLRAKNDQVMESDSDEDLDHFASKSSAANAALSKPNRGTLPVKQRIDPNDFVQAAIKNDSDIESNEEDNESELDFDGDVNIEEADDNGIDVETKTSKSKGSLDFLPGWGSWSSEQQLPQAKKAKRAQKTKVKKVNLVMKEGKTALAPHQLARVPHPYRSIDDCQSDLSQPIGDTFMPKTTVVKTTKPKVQVKLGAVLEADMKDDL